MPVPRVSMHVGGPLTHFIEFGQAGNAGPPLRELYFGAMAARQESHYVPKTAEWGRKKNRNLPPRLQLTGEVKPLKGSKGRPHSAPSGTRFQGGSGRKTFSLNPSSIR